jgi:hypothetical protein
MLYRADLANLVNEAALLAGRLNKEIVEKIDFIHAVERSIAVCCFSFTFLFSIVLFLPKGFVLWNLKFPILTVLCVRP